MKIHKIREGEIEETVKRFLILDENIEPVGLRQWRITEYADAAAVANAVYIEYQYPPDRPDYKPEEHMTDERYIRDRRVKFDNIEERALNKAFSYVSQKGRIIKIESEKFRSIRRYMVYVDTQK